MILTICIFTFASLVSPEAETEECFRTDDRDLARVEALCAVTNKDPISTCEVQRMGATKYYVRIRHLDQSPSPQNAEPAKSTKA